MSNDEPTLKELESPFASAPKKRDFLGLTSRDKDGNMLFSKLGKKVSFKVLSWEWFGGEGEKKQVALVVQRASGNEYLFPIGKTNQYVISDAGITDPQDLVDMTIFVHTYETGSTGNMAIGKRLSFEEWTAKAKK